MEVIVRSATLDDTETIASFNRAMAWETEAKELVPETILAGVRSFLDRPDYGFYFVAECDGKLAGCLMVTFEWSDWRNGLFWWIQSVYVHPDFRRLGVFRALYETVEKNAKTNPGVCGLRLYVEHENHAAQETYRKMGMIETHYLIYESEFSR